MKQNADVTERLPSLKGNRTGTYLLFLCGYAFVTAAYFVLRYSGYWVEQDTGAITTAIKTLRASARIIAPSGPNYPHGFAYQVTANYLLDLTGLTVQTLQTIIRPFLAVLDVPLAFILFREFTNRDRTAALATFFLYLNPEFLFILLRGSHGVQSVGLILLALFYLVRSFKLASRVRTFVIHVALFYLADFALIATNWSFASSFTVALTASFLAGNFLVVRRWRNWLTPQPGLRRLAYTSTACFLLLLVFALYIYRPAIHLFNVLEDATSKVAALTLNFDVRTNPYRYIGLTWIDPRVYLGLSLHNWLLLGTSGLVWLAQARHLFNDRQPRPELVTLLLWLFYAMFALQIAVSLAFDYAGVLAANLQLRLFPILAIFAAPLAATALVSLLERVENAPAVVNNAASRVKGDEFTTRLVLSPVEGCGQPGSPDPVLRYTLEHPRAQGHLGSVLRLGLTLAAVYFSVAAPLKATNEPALSHKWVMYNPAEIRAMTWIEAHLRHVHVWVDIDERLHTAGRLHFPDIDSNNFYDIYAKPDSTRYILLTNITRMRAARAGISLPPTIYLQRIYDNGVAALYYEPPHTIYQH